MTTCEQCGRTITRYCHSQWGDVKAYAWTNVTEDSETDQANGTFCPMHGDYPWVHVPDDQEGEA